MLGLPVSGLALELRNFAQYQSQIGRAESMTRAMGDATNHVVTQGQRMHRVLGTIGIGLGALGVGAAAVLAPITKVTAALERQTMMGEGAARAMGVTQEALQAEREELHKLNIARSVSYEVLNGLLIQNLDFAKSSDLVSAALDMAAYKGMEYTRVIIDYGAAVQNANVSTLRQYGISAQSNAIFDAHARTLGKVTSELTQVEKRVAILNYLLAVSQRIGGAYSAALNTVEGQLRLVSIQTQILRERLGEAFGATMLKAIQRVNQLLDYFINLPKPVQATITRMLAFTAVLGIAAGVLTMLLPGLRVLYSALSVLPGVLTGTSLALATASSTGAKFAILASGFKAKLAGMAAAIGGMNPLVLGLIAALGLLSVAVVKNFGGLGDLVKKVSRDVGRSLTQIWKDVKIWGTAAFEIVRDLVVKPFQWADREVRKITGKLSAQNYGFKFDVAEFFLGGARIMASFALGILQGINNYVLPTLIAFLTQVSRYLIGSSPPPEGPLSKIDIGGVKIIQAWLQGMSSVSLDAVYQIAEEVEGRLTRALWLVQDTLFDIESKERELDAALWPLEDELARVRAAADLVTIPLERQRRVLAWQLEDIKAIAEAERLAAESRLRELERQTAQIQKLLEADRDRLEIIDHEIFMEQMRNKILGQVTSAKLLTMQSSSRVLADQVQQEEDNLKVAKTAEEAERDWLSQLITAAEAQQQAFEAQMASLERLIAMETDRITYAEEEIRLKQALQVETRLAALEERRFWEAEERQISHLLDILSRIPNQLKDRMSRASEGLSDLIEDWEEELLGAFEVPPLKIEADREAIERAKKQLAEIFAPVKVAAERTQKLWKDLEFAWKELVVVVEMRWTESPEEFLKDVARGIGKFITDTANDIDKWHEDTLQTFQDWTDESDRKIYAWAAKAGERVREWTKDTGKTIKEFYLEHIQETITWGTIVNKKIAEWSIIALQTLQRWGIQAFNEMVAWVDKTRDNIGEHLDDLLSTMDKWWERTGIPGVIAHGKSMVNNLIAAAAQSIEAQASKIRNIGQSLLDGIKKGVSDGWDSFKSWLTGKAKSIIDTILKAIHAGSAAKDAIPVGVALVEGIEAGFDAQLKTMMQRLQPKMDFVIEGMMQPVQGFSGQSQVNNNYYYTTQGPSIAIDAKYHTPQAPTSIREDVSLALALAG